VIFGSQSAWKMRKLIHTAWITGGPLGGVLMLDFDRKRFGKLAQDMTNEELMDRITVNRAGMEPEAVEMIEAELARRKVRQLEIDAHEARRRESTVFLPDGTALRCSFCSRPAVGQRWGWHRIWGKIPVFPRRFAYCEEHRQER
jgi:hypothetical protein